MTRVAVVGAGSWGTAVAGIAAGNTDTVLWARRPELAQAMREQHENPEYLPGLPLPESLEFTADLGEACAAAEVVVLGVPSHGLRAVLTEARPFIGEGVPVISLAKGVEQGSLRRMTEVVDEVLAGHDPGQVGVLTGPNLAREVAAGQPAASVVAVRDGDTADRGAEGLHELRRSASTRTPTWWAARSRARSRT